MPLNDKTFPRDDAPLDTVRFAQMVGQSNLLDFVETGISITPDYVNGTVTVGEGVCYVSLDEANSGMDGDTHRSLGFTVQVEETEVALAYSGDNYLAIEPTFDDNDVVGVGVYDTEAAAPEFSLVVARVNQTDETHTLLNREPVGTFERIEVSEDITFSHLRAHEDEDFFIRDANGDIQFRLNDLVVDVGENGAEIQYAGDEVATREWTEQQIQDSDFDDQQAIEAVEGAEELQLSGEVNINNTLDFADFSMYEDEGELVVSGANVELIRQPDEGPTQFIQGIEAGAMQAPDDSFVTAIDVASTVDATLGDDVGYAFAVNAQSAYSILGEAAGDGGLSSLTHALYDELGDVVLTTDGADVEIPNGNLTVDGDAIILGNISATNDHVTVAGNQVSLGGSTSVDHADLSNIGTDDHHTRYADSEAISAVEGETELDLNSLTLSGDLSVTGSTSGISHTDLSNISSDDHHPRYADSEAVSAVESEATLNLNSAVLSGSLDVDSGIISGGVLDVQDDLILNGTSSSRLAALRIGRYGREDWVSDHNDPHVYGSAHGGENNDYPFGELGHLVIQPRTSTDRDVVLATGSPTPGPTLIADSNQNVEIPSGNLVVSGDADISGSVAFEGGLDIDGSLTVNSEDASIAEFIRDDDGGWAQVSIIAGGDTAGARFQWTGSRLEIQDQTGTGEDMLILRDDLIEIPGGDLEVDGRLDVFGSTEINANLDVGGEIDAALWIGSGEDPNNQTISNDMGAGIHTGAIHFYRDNETDGLTIERSASSPVDLVSGGSLTVRAEAGDVDIPNGALTVSGNISAANDHVTVAGNQVSLGGSTSVAHNDLTTISSDDHHQYPVPNSGLVNDDITVTGANGLSGGSASLGGSLSIGISGNLELDADLVSTSAITIWDETAQYIPTSVLETDTVTVAGNAVSLGGSTGINHADLSSISSDDHHTRYADSEARAAVEGSVNAADLIGNENETDRLLTIVDSTGELGWREVQAGEGMETHGNEWHDPDFAVESHDHTGTGESVVPNAGLQNDTVTVAGNAVSLGGSTSVGHADLTGIGENDHHSKDHDHTETDVSTIPNAGLVNDSVTVAGNVVALGGTTGIDHADLSTISSDDHHSRYEDSEAISAIEGALSLDLSGDLNLNGGDISDVGELGTGVFSLYEESGDLVIAGADVELIRQPDEGPTQFIQGIEAGAMQAPDDSFVTAIDVASTTGALSGDDIGYVFSVNAQSAYSIRGEADGDGGVQGLTHTLYDELGDEILETTGANVAIPYGDLSVTGDISAANDHVTVAGNQVSLGGSTGVGHADLTGIGENDHHAKDHDHTETGVSTIPNAGLMNDSVTVAGNAVALGGSTSVGHGDLTGISSDDHHSRYTDSEAVSAVDAQVTATSTTVSGLDSATDSHISATSAHGAGGDILGANDVHTVATTGSHNDLSGISTDDHHTRFSEDAADSIVDIPNRDHADLTGIGEDDHHARYADSEAIAAVEGVASLDLSGDLNVNGGITQDGSSVIDEGDDPFLQNEEFLRVGGQGTDGFELTWDSIDGADASAIYPLSAGGSQEWGGALYWDWSVNSWTTLSDLYVKQDLDVSGIAYAEDGDRLATRDWVLDTSADSAISGTETAQGDGTTTVFTWSVTGDDPIEWASIVPMTSAASVDYQVIIDNTADEIGVEYATPPADGVNLEWNWAANGSVISLESHDHSGEDLNPVNVDATGEITEANERVATRTWVENEAGVDENEVIDIVETENFDTTGDWEFQGMVLPVGVDKYVTE